MAPCDQRSGGGEGDAGGLPGWLTIDRQHKEQDRAAGRQLECPLLVLWSLLDDLEDLYGDILGIWRTWATDVRGHGIASGHHMAEEAPEELAAALGDFFSPA